jgi:large subunit ribosomal protein L24
MWIKANDTVMVMTGDDRGTQGRVLRIQPKAGKLVVEGVNRVYKHVRRSQRNPQGGRLSMEMAIPLSNVALVCQSCKAAARQGARRLPDGSKERYCKKCGAGNGVIAPSKTKQEKKTS